MPSRKKRTQSHFKRRYNLTFIPIRMSERRRWCRFRLTFTIALLWTPTTHFGFGIKTAVFEKTVCQAFPKKSLCRAILVFNLGCAKTILGRLITITNPSWFISIFDFLVFFSVWRVALCGIMSLTYRIILFPRLSIACFLVIGSNKQKAKHSKSK